MWVWPILFTVERPVQPFVLRKTYNNNNSILLGVKRCGQFAKQANKNISFKSNDIYTILIIIIIIIIIINVDEIAHNYCVYNNCV